MSYFPRLPAWKLTFYDTEHVRKHDAELSHLQVGDPVFRQDDMSERTVGDPLIPFNGLVGHRPLCRRNGNLP